MLRDEVLLLLASRQPTTAEELRLAAGAEAAQAVRQADTLLALIATALRQDAAADPPPEASAAAQLRGGARPPGRRLREVARESAAGLGLPPELLAPRRALDAALRSALTDAEPCLPSDLGAGAAEVIGVALLQASAAGAR